MKPNEGRLQTAEHILSHILEHREPASKVVIAKFQEDSGLLEVISAEDLRLVDLAKLQAEVNKVIGKHLAVKKCFQKRCEAEKQFDLSRLPASVTEVRIVELEGFDKTPCKDPHVENTSEIGVFTLQNVKRVGKDRYRFTFKVD
jgi:misacylated tRNA(Ala) deacylase